MGYKLGPTQINGVKSQISRDHRFECQNRELDCVIRNVLFILINFWDLLSEKETNNIYIYIKSGLFTLLILHPYMPRKLLKYIVLKKKGLKAAYHI